ncbi:MAG: translocation/assembly module TamB domain-containing protein, partial [Vicinamibacteria bacterium]
AGATLRLTGTVASPELSGVMSLRPDGSLVVGRNSFQVISARVDFDGFPRSPPALQASTVTKVGETVIQLQIDGEPNDLNIRLRAPEDSSLTEGDLMSLLVTGRTLADAGEGGQQIASTWAMSSFANLIHDGLGDVFSFGAPAAAGPLILAEERNPTSRMTLGLPITERFSITYSLPLDDPERQLWILDYRIAKDLWLRAIQESGTEYTLGFTHRFRIGRKRVLEEPESGSGGQAPARKVGRITFGGDHPLPEDELRKRLKIRSGARYDYWKAQDDANALRKSLIEKGFLSALVEVETRQEDQRVDLLFSVQAGRPTELVWEGDDPGSDIKKRTQAAWDGRIPESYLVSDLAGRARWELRSQRYFQTEVEGRVEAGDDQQRIVFDVSKGPRGRAVVLTFEGNESLPDDELRDALPSTSSPTFFSLLDAKKSELAKGLRLRYASDGYLYANVGEPRTTFDSTTGELRIVIPVDEGPLVRVANIRFEGATSLSEDQLRDALGQKEGDPVRFSQLNEGETNIRTLYRAEGFPDVRLRAELNTVPDGIDVTIGITEGPPVRIGRIRVVGNFKTQRWVIDRELTLKEGDPLRTSDLQESRRNLYDLGVFRTADVRVEATEPGTETRDVIVQVVEREILDMSYGLRYNFVSQTEESGDVDPESQSRGLEGVLRATFPNPLGRSETLSLTAIISPDRPLYRGSYLTPRFFGRRLSTELYAEASIEEEKGKNTLGARAQQWSVNFQQTRKLPRGRLNIQWNYSVGEFALLALKRGAVEVQDDGEFRSRLGGSIFEDERDNVANPTRGRFWNVTMQVAPEFLGSDTSFYRFYGQLFYFHPLGRHLVWASSYRLGLAAGGDEGQFLVLDDRFKAGGPNSVRGFEHNSLGPKLEFPNGDVAFVGGQAVVIMNQELRFPIYKLLHGGAYLDVGEVYPTVKSVRLGGLRVSAGAGLRVVLPFGPLRFDWAEVLNPQENDRLTRFHFSFGYAF